MTDFLGRIIKGLWDLSDAMAINSEAETTWSPFRDVFFLL